MALEGKRGEILVYEINFHRERGCINRNLEGGMQLFRR